MRAGEKAPQSVVDAALRMYRDGTDVATISATVGLSGFSIHRYARLAGLRRYGDRLKKSVWDGAFDLLTDEAFYWLGLLITDGSIVGKNRVKLSLEKEDQDAIHKFKSFTRAEHPVTFYDNVAEIRFTSPRMVSRLSDLGVRPRKTRNATAPPCALDSPHFWRGVIDGDGGIHDYGSPLLTLTGASYPLLRQWARVWSGVCSFTPNVVERPKAPGVYDVRVVGPRVLTMLRWLRYDAYPSMNSMRSACEAVLAT